MFYVGRKSGKGLFTYEEGVKDRPENQGVLDILKKYHVPPKVP